MRKIYYASALAAGLLLMYSCGNTPAGQPGASDTAAAPAKATGDAIYKKTCIACHQANGEGIAGTFPPLAKSDFISDREKTISQVIKGYSGELTVNCKKYNSAMPAQQLNDEEIASVLSYVYSNFGNGGTAVTADEVKAVRSKI